jgi:hypothetical protein
MRTYHRETVKLGPGGSCQVQRVLVICNECDKATIEAQTDRLAEEKGIQAGWVFVKARKRGQKGPDSRRDICPYCAARLGIYGYRPPVQRTLF